MAYNPYEAASALPMSPQQARAQRGLGPLAGGQPGRRRVESVEELGSTGPQVTDQGSGGSTGTQGSGVQYPPVLPPPTPEMLAALEQRRRTSLRGLLETEAAVEDQRMRAELEAIGRQLGIEEDIGRQRREGMIQLASRGVARSPLFANPFRRGLARAQQEQVAQSQQTLASTLDQLNMALNVARQRREGELAQIAFDEAMARSDPRRLMGA